MSVLKNKKMRTALKLSALLAAIGGLFFVSSSMAAVNALSLTSISSNVGKSVVSLAAILSDVSLMAGIGFVMASFFKFHQHKLNPTQVPLSQGITLLLIGAGLVVFPYMVPTAKQAIFGSSAKVAKVGGSEIGSLIGST